MAGNIMYEQVIRSVIQRSFDEFGQWPHRIAVTKPFMFGLRQELKLQGHQFAYNTMAHQFDDVIFGGDTRVYAVPDIDTHKPSVDLSKHVIAWEVILSKR